MIYVGIVRAAKCLDTTTRTLRRLVEEEELPVVLIGKREGHFILGKALNEYIDSGRAAKRLERSKRASKLQHDQNS